VPCSACGKACNTPEMRRACTASRVARSLTSHLMIAPTVLLVAASGCSDRTGTSFGTAGTAGGGIANAGNATGGSTTGGSTTGGSTTGGNGGNGGLGGGGTSGLGGAGSGASGASGSSAAAGAGGSAGNAAGAAGAGGAAAAGGTGGGGGSAGEAAGAAGLGSSGGAGGTGGAGTCTFEIEDMLSTAIPTVGIVNWSTGLAALSGARIEFTLDDPADDEFNRGSGGAIDITGETHRALLLGLKPERTYTYRIVAESGGTVCTSPDRSLTTGAGLDTFTHTLTRTAGSAIAPAQGFIVTTSYSSTAYIIDTDGDIVWWWATGPTSMSRARMDWEGENMWMLQVLGNQGGQGEVSRVSMDGAEVMENVAGLNQAHHDLAVLPGGITAFLVWSGGASAATDLVERAPDGTLTTIARLDERVYVPRTTFHANTIAYHAADDTFTVGDLEAGGFVKLARTGEPLWQFMAACPSMPVTKCAAGTTVGNHGHHLLDDGSFLFIKARYLPSVKEYKLTETASALTATEVWPYDQGTNLETYILGDVQRLPNGNTLIVYSTAGEMREISPAGDVVQTIVSERSFGYADFRETLYGPPLR